jgi:hypothetical protein
VQNIQGIAGEEAIQKALPFIQVFDVKLVIDVVDFHQAQQPREKLSGILYGVRFFFSGRCRGV